MISLELNFQGFSYYGIRLSDQDFIIGVYPPDQWPVSHRIIPKRAQHWINDSEYDRYIYIYWIWPLYIYIMCKINRAQALFQYLIRSYHISSRRHEECILFDRFELWHASQQQCCSTALSPPDSLRRVSNFQVKQSRIFETSSHGIWNLQQLTRKHVRVCRRLSLLLCKWVSQMTLAEIE